VIAPTPFSVISNTPSFVAKAMAARAHASSSGQRSATSSIFFYDCSRNCTVYIFLIVVHDFEQFIYFLVAVRETAQCTSS
jgi:hypothetical protein